MVPVEPAGAVLEDHAVAVREGRIEAVLPASGAAAAYPGYETLDLPGHVLIPGLVNAHTHAAMCLMRGLSDDLPLMRWLQEHIWPAEAQHVSPEFVRDGTLLACAEMLRGGVTCFNDMYFFPEASLEAALAAGMRSAQGLITLEFPSAYASDAAGYLARGLAVRDRWREEPLASFCLAPHAPYTVSDDSFRRIAALAAELDLPEGGVGHRVGRVRGEAERGERLVAAAVAQREALAQIVGRIRGVGGREVDDDDAQRRPHAGGERRLQRRLREEVHLVEAGDAPAQHLGAGEQGAVAHHRGRHVLALGRPDVVFQPAHERQVVGHAAHQGHRRVGMGVDQPRDQHVVGQLDRGVVGPAGAGSENRFYAALGHRHGVAFEDPAGRLDRNQPAGLDQEPG